MALQKLFPSDTDKIEQGSLIKVVSNNEYYKFGSKELDATNILYKLAVYQNCIKITLLLDDVKEIHYEYHEDIFNSGNYEMFDGYIVDLQSLVFNLWQNPNYDGYITNDGINLRNRFIKSQKSKL